MATASHTLQILRSFLSKDIHLLTDMQLIDKLEKADSKVFREIYNRYWKGLFLHSIRMLHDNNLARDVVQNVFTTLLSNPSKVKSHGTLDSYLYDLVRKEILVIIMEGKVNHLDYYLKLLALELEGSQEEVRPNIKKMFESESVR